MAPTRVAYDERLLEWILEPHVEIVHPEEMTLVEQIAAFEASEAVVGVVGSAFHTSLMTRQPPVCVYLFPPPDATEGLGGTFRGAFPAQDELLGTSSEFAFHALESTGVCVDRIKVRNRTFFPAAYRLAIPRVLRLLQRAVLPDLFEDPRAAALAQPERMRSRRGGGRSIEASVAAMLHEPLAAPPRIALGEAFEREGLDACALEQFLTAADMADDQAPALDGAVRVMGRLGEREEEFHHVVD